MPPRRPREALWLSTVLAEEGDDVTPATAQRLLELHRAYLDARRRTSHVTRARRTPRRRCAEDVARLAEPATRIRSVSMATRRRPARRRTSAGPIEPVDRRSRPPSRPGPRRRTSCRCATRARRSPSSSDIPDRRRPVRPVATTTSSAVDGEKMMPRRHRRRGAGERHALGIRLGGTVIVAVVMCCEPVDRVGLGGAAARRPAIRRRTRPSADRQDDGRGDRPRPSRETGARCRRRGRATQGAGRRRGPRRLGRRRDDAGPAATPGSGRRTPSARTAASVRARRSGGGMSPDRRP